ncbi:MAG: branched-chain amino acid ABC transporter substrate-binding protein [Pseudomonadota bacterium]
MLLTVLPIAAGVSNVRAEVLKIAMIETFSGPFAPIAQNQFNTYRMFAGLANRRQLDGVGNTIGHTIEVNAFDGKGSVQESLSQLKTAIDQGYRYIAQGNGSGVALALLDAVNKHNQRNPGKEIVFLNHAAIDPELTNGKCSFWHFRFDANSDMKMEALTAFMQNEPTVRKVYLIGQNYAHGQAVSRAAKELLKRRRPDIQIVGDDLHPIGSVKDFSPYIAKIKASGADTVITGNWGADLALLIRAAKDGGLAVKFYTYYGRSAGVPTAMGAAGIGQVKTVVYWHENNETFSGHALAAQFRATYDDDLYFVSIITMMEMLARAVAKTGSIDPSQVAHALEGMKIMALNGEVEMRAVDHQLQQPLYIATWSALDGKRVKYDQEKTGFGWKTDRKIESHVAAQPTSCEMSRPPKR